MELIGLPSPAGGPNFRPDDPITPRFPTRPAWRDRRPPAGNRRFFAIASAQPTPEGAAALAAAQELARNASAPATLRAYKADWTHFSEWCAAKGFVPVPAAPEVVGAYLASLAETHAPATIRRRLSALGKMHRYNDLPWNAAHGAIQGPLQGLLRRHGRPPQKAAALSLAMLRQLLATCDRTARGRRDRALLLFGFAGALRRSELVALQVEDVGVDANGLRLRILRGKTDQEGQGAEIGLPRGRHAETCPLRAFEDWRAVARRERRAAVSQNQHARADRRRRRCTRTRCGGFCSIASAWPG